MKLGIVGHAQEKFTPVTEALAREAIRSAIEAISPELIVSGHSPMGGVDLYAEDAAAEYGILKLIFQPDVHQWDPPGRYGFKARNLDIAKHSDVVLVVVVESLPPGFSGKTFGNGCYHCGARNPRHIKSGACWTAWRCPQHLWRIVRPPNFPSDFRKSGDQDPEPRQEDPATAQDQKRAGDSPSHTKTHGEQ